jgi:7-carboxy-7-deazaguanine synthase
MRKALAVTEIFRSIQGESSYAGLPCVFVRLSGCNLDCAWCDTRYAREKAGRVMELDAVIDAVRELGSGVVEITGGEPLLQQETPELARQLVKLDYTVLVETNGSQDISPLLPPVVRIIDIKCPSSGMTGHNNWYNIPQLRPSDELKFVIADRNDYEWAREVIEKHSLHNKCTVLLSAVTNRLNPGDLADWALWDNLEIRMQVQLQKIFWPDRVTGA